MTSSPPEHVFDEALARWYLPRHDHVKTAILVVVADPDAVTVIRTSFGEQTMRGAFYAVSEGNGSYGATQEQFERTHERLSATTWRKSAPVLAYPADGACRVDTYVADTREASIVARPGDWIVRQAGGEVMVLSPEAFEERYQSAA